MTTIVDRIHAYKEEKSSLKDDILAFYNKISRYTGVSGKGSHNNGWRLTKAGDYLLNTFIDGDDPIPYIEIDWEYADCGSDPYGFPAHWMDLTDAEWQAEYDDRVRVMRERRAAQDAVDKAAAELSQEHFERHQLRILQEKYGVTEKSG